VLVEVAVVADRAATAAAFASAVTDLVGRLGDDGLDPSPPQQRPMAATAVGLVAEQRVGAGACPTRAASRTGSIGLSFE